mmetsp:Transcript_5047/g.12713  ORF Transcript_5047/g.12713 Transcript_5047/m.12713 type:complete len:306 (-) Transcript_5047:771-1688(-)
MKPYHVMVGSKAGGGSRLHHAPMDKVEHRQHARQSRHRVAAVERKGQRAERGGHHLAAPPGGRGRLRPPAPIVRPACRLPARRRTGAGRHKFLLPRVQLRQPQLRVLEQHLLRRAAAPAARQQPRQQLLAQPAREAVARTSLRHDVQHRAPAQPARGAVHQRRQLVEVALLHGGAAGARAPLGRPAVQALPQRAGLRLGVGGALQQVQVHVGGLVRQPCVAQAGRKGVERGVVIGGRGVRRHKGRGAGAQPLHGQLPAAALAAATITPAAAAQRAACSPAAQAEGPARAVTASALGGSKKVGGMI